jgi:hypothetical protein
MNDKEFQEKWFAENRNGLSRSACMELWQRAQQSEREACANLCEFQATGHRDGFGLHLAALIRDRTPD